MICIYIYIYLSISMHPFSDVLMMGWCTFMYFPCSISILLRFSYCKGPEVRAAPRVLEHFGRVQEDVKAVEVLCRNSDRYNRPKRALKKSVLAWRCWNLKTTTNKLWPFFDACCAKKIYIYIYNIIDFRSRFTVPGVYQRWWLLEFPAWMDRQKPWGAVKRPQRRKARRRWRWTTCLAAWRLRWSSVTSLFLYIHIYMLSAPARTYHIYIYVYIYYIYVTRDPFRSSQTSRRTQERYPPEALGILGFLTTNPGIPHLKTI